MAAGVPPTPRAPHRPREPPLPAPVLDTLNAAKSAAAAEEKRREDADKAAKDFRSARHVPEEPAEAPGSGVFDKRGYMKELRGKAEAAHKDFEARAKAWDPYSEDPGSRTGLELAAKRAIRLYLQVGGLEPIPSGPTFQIGRIHQRLGNLHDAVECFENVIEVDPTAKCADTAAAWDTKGTILLQLGSKPSEAAGCFREACRLKPTDPIFKKHLRDAEAPPAPVRPPSFELAPDDDDAPAAAAAAAGGKKKKKKKKGAGRAGGTGL